MTKKPNRGANRGTYKTFYDDSVMDISPDTIASTRQSLTFRSDFASKSLEEWRLLHYQCVGSFVLGSNSKNRLASRSLKNASSKKVSAMAREVGTLAKSDSNKSIEAFSFGHQYRSSSESIFNSQSLPMFSFGTSVPRNEETPISPASTVSPDRNSTLFVAPDNKPTGLVTPFSTETNLFEKPQPQQQTGGLFGTTIISQPSFSFGQQQKSVKPLAGFNATNNLFDRADTRAFVQTATPSGSGGLFRTQNAFGGGLSTSKAVGTTIKFNPPAGTDSMMIYGISTDVSTKHYCLTAMKEYEGKSLEELRLGDYSLNQGVPQVNRSTAFGSGFVFDAMQLDNDCYLSSTQNKYLQMFKNLSFEEARMSYYFDNHRT